MKTRLGFVSNSSSSSFVIRKSALDIYQINELRRLFKEHKNYFETNTEEDDYVFSGRLEAHNGKNEEGKDSSPLANIVDELMDKWKISPMYDYMIEYEGFAELCDR